MGIDAVAVLHCNDSSLLEQLSATDRLGADLGEQLAAVLAAVESGADDLPIPLVLTVLRVGRDWALIYTGVRFREIEHDPIFAQIVATRVLASLPAGAHVEPRGMLVYPDVAEPRGPAYDDIVEALRPHLWAATAPLDAAARRSWQRAKMATLGLGSG